MLSQNCTHFPGMLGEDEKIIREKNYLKNRATEQIGKRLLPGSGETDCNDGRAEKIIKKTTLNLFSEKLMRAAT